MAPRVTATSFFAVDNNTRVSAATNKEDIVTAVTAGSSTALDDDIDDDVDDSMPPKIMTSKETAAAINTIKLYAAQQDVELDIKILEFFTCTNIQTSFKQTETTNFFNELN